MDGYKVVKISLIVIECLAFITEFVLIMKLAFLYGTRNPDRKKKGRTATAILIAFVIFGASYVAYYQVTVKQYENISLLDNPTTIEISSDSIKNGEWAKEVGFKNGNKSPDLSWNAVENAKTYAIVMIDHDGNNWLHWFDYSKECKVSAGEFTNASDGYVGPYPPSGTHNYTVYVFALRSESKGVSEKLDTAGADIEAIAKELGDGKTAEYANILAYGTLVGTYSAE